MRSEIKEYEDRWVVQPMRGGRVVRTRWLPDQVEFETDTQFRIVVGYGAELAHGSIAEDSPGRHAIGHWSRDEVERMVAAPVVSPVFFKSGSLRVGFRNGWMLLVSHRHPEVSAALFFQDRPIWTRSGLRGSMEFTVVAVDPWSGRRIDAPPWPTRPSNLDGNSEDING